MRNEDYIWMTFENATAEGHLSGGHLPNRNCPLRDRLDDFWQCAKNPQVQGLLLLARTANSTRMDYQTDTTAEGMTISFAPSTRWFSVQLSISVHGVGYAILGENHTAYSWGMKFDRHGLTQTAPTINAINHPMPRYIDLLDAIIEQSISECQALDAAIESTTQSFVTQ